MRPMIRAALFLAAVAAATAATDAGTLRRAGEPGLRVISAHAVSAHIRFLADDTLEGRRSGERGHAIAARYIATQMQALGLAPADGQGSYLQPVPLRSIKPDRARSRLTILKSDGTPASEQLRADDDYIVGGDADRAQIDVTAPIVF